MKNGFLPISKEDMREAGIDQLDFVYVCGDAYVDHPSLRYPHLFVCLIFYLPRSAIRSSISLSLIPTIASPSPSESFATRSASL